MYRERKRAAEEAERMRTARLEGVVEELGGILMSFADDLIAVDEVRRNHTLMTSLQKTIRKSIAMTNEVLDMESTQGEESSRDPEVEESAVVRPHAIILDPVPPTETRQDQHEYGSSPLLPYQDDSQSAYTPTALTRSFASATSLDHLLYPRIAQQTFGNGWMDYHGDFVNHHPPNTGANGITPDTFPYRLVEQSVAHSFNVLLRDVSITTDKARSIFRWSLGTKTREGLLCHLRWMLGPGRFILSRAAGIPAKRYTKALACGKSLDDEENDDCGSHASPTFASDLGDEEASSEPLALLSARDVDDKLDSLQARPVGNNILELTISSPAPTEMTMQKGENDNNRPSAPGVRQGLTTFLTLRLSLSLLIQNLSTTAICLQAGPGYPETELGRIIQESMLQPAEMPMFVV